MKIYNELESLGFFKWLSETHNLVDTDMESEYLDKLPLNDIHRTVCNSMAFRWFRDKHKIEAVVACYYSKILDISYEERQYHCHIVRDGVTTKGPKFKTYEEAESACIDKLITIIKI